MRERLARLDTAIGHLLRGLAMVVAASIGLIALLVPLNLLLIKMRWGSMWWLYEAVEYTLYVGVFIGAPWVLRQGAHVRVDVVTSALPRGIARRLERFLDLAGASLCLLLCYYGTRSALLEYVDGTLPDKDLRIDNWYMMTVFAVSFLLLAVEFLMRLWRTSDDQTSTVSDIGF